MIENKFERGLWNTRFIVLISVILSIISSIILFVLGGWDIIQAIIYNNPVFNENINSNNEILFKIISSIDLFLIGIVLLIFGFGVYELFISEIDFAKNKFKDSTLKINNLDQLKNKIKAVVACGNGTAGVFAPNILEGIGCEVVKLDCELDWSFPKYNPNPEDLKMLRAISKAVKTNNADIGFGFDGDGDRCGVIDEKGNEIFSDKIGF